jgi:hypothetical protein
MSAQTVGDNALIQPAGPLGMRSSVTTLTYTTDTIAAASESAALGLLPEDDNYNHVGE